MSAKNVQLPEDTQLREQIAEAEQKLGGLEDALSGIDSELEGLGTQRETFSLLEQTCNTLAQLEALGAGELFWGKGNVQQSGEYIEQVRKRANSYLSQVGKIEQRRQTVVEEIKKGQDVLDILEGDLDEFVRAEQERQEEWVIERNADLIDHDTAMPWIDPEDDGRLRKSMSWSLLAALILGAIIPFIDLPIPEFELLPEIPERFARLIEQELPPPPPPQVVEEVVQEEVVEPEPEPVVAEEVPEVVPEAQEEPVPMVVDEPAPEREVRSAGILAFSESFANIRDERPAPGLGADARINNAGEDEVGRTERAMVTSQAPGSSGGINLGSLSRNVGGGGGGQMDGVAVSRVASSIGGTGTGNRPMSGGAAGGRTDEEIQIVFDRYKSALYRLYNRELRNDPTLRGQVVLRLTIEPDGSVSFVAVQSSGLGAPTLEQQIADRVGTFDFGAKEGIAAMTIVYPIDFLPAG
jgi:outer membrane biosynthesis protein TonB